jgi:hypothetical protein
LFDKTYTQESVDILVPISYMAIKFAIKKRNLMNITKLINDALNAKKEKLAAERLINGFTQSYTHYGVGGSRTIATVGGDALEAFYLFGSSIGKESLKTYFKKQYSIDKNAFKVIEIYKG